MSRRTTGRPAGGAPRLRGGTLVAVGLIALSTLCCCGGLLALGADGDADPVAGTTTTTVTTTPTVTAEASTVTTTSTPPPAPVAPSPSPEPTSTPPPAPTTTPPPEPEQGPGETPFANCTEARATGGAPVHRGDPGYGSHLDRDGDGVGCES